MSSGIQALRAQQLGSVALLLLAIAALFATRLSHDATILFLARVAGGIAFTAALTLFASLAGRNPPHPPHLDPASSARASRGRPS